MVVQRRVCSVYSVAIDALLAATVSMRTSCSARAHEVELRRESSFKKWSHDDNRTPLGQFSCPWRTPAGPWLMARLAWASFTAKRSKGTHTRGRVWYFCTHTTHGPLRATGGSVPRGEMAAAAVWASCIKYVLKFVRVVVLVDADGAVRACGDARLQGGFRGGVGRKESEIEHLE